LLSGTKGNARANRPSRRNSCSALNFKEIL
jgi:hypothetical protein